MNNYVNLALAYKSEGFTVIPVNSNKIPTINWTKYQKEPMSDEDIKRYFKNVHGLAMLTGGKSQVECLDIDLKNCNTGDLIDRLKAEVPKSIMKKMWVQRTPSGGYHWIFRCDKVEPNQKLANRVTSAEEKHSVYIEHFNNIKTRKNALKIASQYKSLVLLETRGGEEDKSGGYFLVAPTKGYEKVYGKLSEISIEERDQLMTICRSFNEYSEPKKNNGTFKYGHGESNPFDDFNERGDSLSLLLDAGWTSVYENESSVRLKRPGSTHSKSSALFDKDSKIFNVFSSSTDFDTNTGYNPASVFIKIEADDDTQLAYQKLKKLGYGG